MPKTWNKISQDNVDFYVNHPVASTVMTVLGTIVAVVAVNTLAKTLTKPQELHLYLPPQ